MLFQRLLRNVNDHLFKFFRVLPVYDLGQVLFPTHPIRQRYILYSSDHRIIQTNWNIIVGRLPFSSSSQSFYNLSKPGNYQEIIFQDVDLRPYKKAV